MPSDLVEHLVDPNEKISVAFLGSALDSGRMEAVILADSLRGLGRLTNRVSYLAFGSRYDHRLEIDGSFQPGSLIVPLHIASQLFADARTFLDSRGAQELSTLMSILGWGAIPGTVSVFYCLREKKEDQFVQKMI
jgi:hypothetical protein